MKIRLYKDSDRKAWDEYVMRHPDGTFFHQIGWKEVVEKSFGHKAYYLVAHKDSSSVNEITGILPLFSVKSRLFGKSMVSLPFATLGGILADDSVIVQSLFDLAASLTVQDELAYLELRGENPLVNRLKEKNLYFGFKKEIFPDNDQNLNAIPRKSRRMVRQGMKNDLKVEFGHLDLIEQFYRLFAVSYHRLGSPVFPKRYLKCLLETFGNESFILIVSKNGQPLSAVLSFYFKDQVLPYYSGAYLESQRYAANDYLYWALMSHAAEEGCRVFDFGRSKADTGPFHFKRHWGFEPKALKYQYYLNRIDEIPNVSPSNPKYQRKIELWKKMPLWATKILGPRIVKYIP